MIQCCNRLRLLLKATQSLWIAGEGCREHLDCDFAVEPRITRPIHLTHSASAQRGENFIWTEFSTRDKRHPRAQLELAQHACSGSGDSSWVVGQPEVGQKRASGRSPTSRL